MKPRILVMAALAAALTLLAPTAALAKGASAATIDGSGPGGPGNGPNGPITLGGNGEPGSGTDLGTLADLSGLFPAMFGQSPDPMLDAAPTKRLGPRYTITWTIPDGSGTAKKIRQGVYPYAAGGPVTYTSPGQPVFDQTTRGGWYKASDSLRQHLISLGLPNKAPLAAASGGGSAANPAGGANASPAPARPAAADAPAVWPRVLVGGALLLLVAGTAAVVLRRRPGPATAR
ncbi:MAG TPA: hypothetical protein VG276_10320 [Actinomycetes bacterium]|jgi:hypothetical protein|nr:hypothetical protein [Actinomycetes bacterium]